MINFRSKMSAQPTQNKIICLRKSDVSIERISDCNAIKSEHGIHCLSCSYTNDVKDPLP